MWGGFLWSPHPFPHSPPCRQGPEGRDRASSRLEVVRTGREGGCHQPSQQDEGPWALRPPCRRRGKCPGPGGERREAPGPSRPQELLDHVAGEAVEEEGQHEQRQQRQHDLDDEPLVPRADEVLDGLEGVEEPDKGRVGPAGGGRVLVSWWHVQGTPCPQPC